jgi:hypothetical protein
MTDGFGGFEAHLTFKYKKRHLDAMIYITAVMNFT